MTNIDERDTFGGSTDTDSGVQFVPSDTTDGVETEDNDADIEGTELTEDGEFAEGLDLDVDATDGEDDEVEDVPDGAVTKTKDKPAKAKEQPKRGDLPEGYVTPVGLAKVITERRLYTTRDGVVGAELKPQMVYSYIKNAPKANPFPGEEVTDSNGNKRFAVEIEKGVAWWEAKNASAQERKENAARKLSEQAKAAAAKAAAAGATTTGASDGDVDGTAEEAE